MSSPTPTPEIQSAPRSGKAARLWLLSISIVVILFDRFTKFWVDRHLALGSAIVVIPHVFRITHVLNTGAAFSFFAESASPASVRNALIIFSILAAIMVFVMLWRVGPSISITSVALAFILGGALGNLYDRLHYHFVIDFLEVHIVNYHWPDFNVADSAIVVGACLLLLEIFRPQPPEDSSN
jgi:signal peptidase II